MDKRIEEIREWFNGRNKKGYRTENSYVGYLLTHIDKLENQLGEAERIIVQGSGGYGIRNQCLAYRKDFLKSVKEPNG